MPDGYAGTLSLAEDPHALVRRAHALMLEAAWETEHVLQVTRLSLELFDQLAPVLGIPGETRHLLHAAALIHDTCYARVGRDHHKAAHELAMKHLTPDFGEGTASVVGLIARYHRKKPPKADHRPFSRLTPGDQQLVRQLASLLRICDGLDRSHGQVVEHITCTVQTQSVTLDVFTRGDAAAERDTAQAKAGLFEETFGKTVRLRVLPAE